MLWASFGLNVFCNRLKLDILLVIFMALKPINEKVDPKNRYVLDMGPRIVYVWIVLEICLG